MNIKLTAIVITTFLLLVPIAFADHARYATRSGNYNNFVTGAQTAAGIGGTCVPKTEGADFCYNIVVSTQCAGNLDCEWVAARVTDGEDTISETIAGAMPSTQAPSPTGAAPTGQPVYTMTRAELQQIISAAVMAAITGFQPFFAALKKH
ncbi:MAG TPA: hypothetical protein VI612_00720, partial [Candidatus Nanoarchaeia archaeon]|nr:hypothetical protein [Candidatus Nanoarchaeia archaeon]